MFFCIVLDEFFQTLLHRLFSVRDVSMKFCSTRLQFCDLRRASMCVCWSSKSRSILSNDVDPSDGNVHNNHDPNYNDSHNNNARNIGSMDASIPGNSPNTTMSAIQYMLA